MQEIVNLKYIFFIDSNMIIIVLFMLTKTLFIIFNMTVAGGDSVNPIFYLVLIYNNQC